MRLVSELTTFKFTYRIMGVGVAFPGSWAEQPRGGDVAPRLALVSPGPDRPWPWRCEICLLVTCRRPASHRPRARPWWWLSAAAGGECLGDRHVPVAAPQWLFCQAARGTWSLTSPFPGLVQYETRARLERLAASSSISSADLFDEQKKQPAGEWEAGGANLTRSPSCLWHEYVFSE